MNSYDVTGDFADILTHATRLARSPDAGTLVIGVVNATPFLQFAGGAERIEMDFPVITAEQRERAPAFKRFLAERGLTARVTEGRNGEVFLDVDLPGDPARVAQVARDLLTEVWEVDPAAQLTFLGENLGD